MTDIFICCRRERQKAAGHLAESLRLFGYAVRSDDGAPKVRDSARPFDSRMQMSKAVIALWCGISVASDEMREEAGIARALGLLVSVKIEPCALPPGVRDPIDLSNWDGSPRDPRLDPLLDEIAAKVGRPPAPDWHALREYEAAWRRAGAQTLRTLGRETPLGLAAGGVALPGRAPLAPPPLADGAEAAADGGNGARLDARLSPLVLAMTEWREIQDTQDIRRLKRFAAHFPGYYGDLALDRVATLEEDADRARAEEAAREPFYRAEGRVQVAVGAPPRRDAARWIKAGGGRDAAETFRDLPEGPEMAVVPACPEGFTMGSPKSEPERLAQREGQRRVTIAKAFAVGRCAVTRGEFAAFVAATGHDMGDGKWIDPGFAQDDSHPVVCVNWEDAVAYAAWLATATGKPYRLLSEAEWEYAARAGTATPFWWGKTITPSQANYDGNRKYSGGGAKGVYRPGTLPADYTREDFKPNPWGLHQVHGNVWEWCADCWNETLPDKPGDGSAAFAGDCNFRVLRGGARVDFPAFLRSAFRNALAPGLRGAILGFRVARTLEPDRPKLKQLEDRSGS